MKGLLAENIVLGLRDRLTSMEGEVVSRPMLMRTDGTSLTYAVDVKINGQDEPLKAVPLANTAKEVMYADPGAAVTLTRGRGGRFEVTGFAKKKPGTRKRVPVNLTTGDVGEVVETGVSIRVLSYDELATIGGGYGVAPYGGIATFKGGVLVSVKG